jgi:hypothetical protein
MRSRVSPVYLIDSGERITEKLPKRPEDEFLEKRYHGNSPGFFI